MTGLGAPVAIDTSSELTAISPGARFGLVNFIII